MQDFSGTRANGDHNRAHELGLSAAMPNCRCSQVCLTAFCVCSFCLCGICLAVLKPGGLLLQVDACPDHLRELREIIYPAIAGKHKRNPSPAGFKQLSTTTIRYPD